MKNETVEMEWSMKEYQHTIGLSSRGITDLLYLKYGLEDYDQNEQKEIIDRVIDGCVQILWRLSNRIEPYKQFKKKYLKQKIEDYGLEE